MTVLDISSNDLSTLDPVCFKASGVTGVICGVYSPDDAPNTMRQAALKCRDAGLTIHGFYGLIYFGSTWGEIRDTMWACQLAEEFGVKRVWLDCEIDAAGIFTDAHAVTPQQRVAAIQRSVDVVEKRGLEAGIYSGSWWWPSGTDNSEAFSHLPLWNSYFDQDPDVDGLPYGGWTWPAVEQYSSTIEWCGRRRDTNFIYEGDAVTKEEYENLCLAIAAGSEETDSNGVLRPREQRLANALYRINDIAAGKQQSINDKAASAIALIPGGKPVGTKVTGTFEGEISNG